jgi:hypothetical protein
MVGTSALDAPASASGIKPDTNGVEVGVAQVTPRLVAETERIFGDAEVRAWPKSRGGLNGPQSTQR